MPTAQEIASAIGPVVKDQVLDVVGGLSDRSAKATERLLSEKLGDPESRLYKRVRAIVDAAIAEATSADSTDPDMTGGDER